MKIGPHGLYAIADTGLLAPGEWIAKIEQALAGGARLVQYRHKKNDGAALKERRARELVQLCGSYDVPLIVNDDPRLARASGAQGVHLGREDMDVAEARAVLGPDAIIGVSCYNDPARAQASERAGADYTAFGSFFPSSTKPDAAHCRVSILKEARKLSDLPICAIGGITVENAPSLIEAGADWIAAAGGLFAQPDVKATAQRFATLFYHSPYSRARMPG